MRIANVDIFKISYSEDLTIKPEILKTLIKLFGKSLPSFCRMTLPIVLKNEDGYKLVARHYSYDVFLHHIEDASDIPVLIISEDERSEILRAEGIEIEALVAGQKALKTGLTPAGSSLKKHRQAGMKCPICAGTLVGPKDRKAIESGEHAGYYEVTCRNKSNSKKPCKFRTYFSNEEMGRFWERTYPTSAWLTILDEKCPQCGKRLFLRMRGEKKVTLCEDNFFVDGICTYRR